MFNNKKKPKKPNYQTRRLSFENLESRQMLSAAPNSIDLDSVPAATTAYPTDDNTLQVDFSTEYTQPKTSEAYYGTRDLKAYAGGSLSTRSISRGDYFDLETGTVKNLGTADITSSFKIKIYASTSYTFTTSVYLGEWTVYSDVDAGESITIDVNNISTSKLTPGKTYYIGWLISGVSGETVTSNNSAKCYTQLTVKSANLQANNGGSLSSSSVLKGNTFDLTTGIVKNIGNDYADGGYAISVYASTNATISTYDVYLGTWYASSGISAGYSKSLNIDDVPTSKLTGGVTYYIGWIITRVNNEVVTSNNTARCYTRLTVIKPRPNLIAYDGGSLSTHSITRGKRFTLTLGKIKNIGTGSTSGIYYVRIYASRNATISTNDIFIGYTAVHTTLGVNSSLSLTVSSITTSKLGLGTYYIGWMITKVNGELITSDNTGVCYDTLTVKKPVVGTGYYYYPGTFANYTDYTIRF